MLSRTSPSSGAGSAEVTGFHDEGTGSIQYLVADPETGRAALIDVVLDFDPASARTSTETAEEILRHVGDRGLKVDWILDTHPHADHFMASAFLKERLDAPTAIGEKVKDVARLWRELYNLPSAFDPEIDFDHLLADGETFRIGNLPVRVMLTPGHTLASVTYVVGTDAAFVHDTFMHVDAGTARADFPGGSSRVLFRSLQEILALDDATRLFVGHDYGSDEREEPAWESTVAEQRAHNVHVGRESGKAPEEDDYVRLRDERDAGLDLPERMLFALQANLRGGRLPPPEADGNSYFKIPANRF